MSDTAATARALAALGHEARLDIFRLLVRAGPDGLSVGQIAAHLGLAASTLAHHLRMLRGAGLVTQDRQGREVITRADFDEMRRVTTFLTDACCTGVSAADSAA